MLVTVRKTSLICVTAYYMQGNDLVHAKRRTTDYGPPERSFFENPKLLGSMANWAENFGAFGVFSANLSAPSLVL